MKKYFLVLLASLLIVGSKVDAKEISLSNVAAGLKETTSYNSYQQPGYEASITNTDTTLKIHAAYTGTQATKYSYDINFTYSNGVLSYQKEPSKDQWRDSNISMWLSDLARTVGKLYGYDENKIVSWFNESSKEDLSKLTLENNGVEINFTSYTCGVGSCRYYESFKISLKDFDPFNPITPTTPADPNKPTTPSKDNTVTKNPKTADLNVTAYIVTSVLALAAMGLSLLKISKAKKTM